VAPREGGTTRRRVKKKNEDDVIIQTDPDFVFSLMNSLCEYSEAKNWQFT